VEVLSGAEILLDYSEDEISAEPGEASGRLPGEALARDALARLRKLAETWRFERVCQEGLTAVIAGRPNSGKSSLFNILLKEERSIVTEVPGTTRDWIEAWISVEGVPVRLIDTAGLRDSPDPVEKIGVERSRDLLEASDLVLYVVDGAAGFTGEDAALTAGLSVPCLTIWNKTDIAPVPAEADAPANTGGKFVAVSAKTGDGVTELLAAISGKIAVNAEPSGPAAALGTVRQKNLTEAAAAALEEALKLSEKNEPLDLVVPLIREAVNALGEITGEVSTADILEEMFGKFCVGK